MTTVNGDLAAIRTKVRRLTASPSTSQISDADINDYINVAWQNDFAQEIKDDLFREVVEVFVQPNQDRYALSGDVNTTSTPNVNTTPTLYESVREPVYVEGRRADFYKDRGQFYNAWPRTASLDTSMEGDGATLAFTLALGAPVLQNEVVIGALDINGTYQKLEDGGDGIIYVAGTTTNVGTVTYSTGAITITAFPVAPASGETINVWYYTYSPGRPQAMMFWKNELIVRPVPDKVYRVEVEAYKVPSELSTDASVPEVSSWFQYLAMLASVKILSDRQDMEGVNNLVPLIDRQQRLIQNRKANAQTGMRNATLYEGDNERFNFPYNYF